MVWIPGGTFTMGSDHHYAEEAPAHRVTVDGFWMDKYLVTNAQFQKFVKATGYVTVAERPANPDDYPGAQPDLLEPSSCVFVKPDRPVDKGSHYNWWAYIAGANWRHPEGPGSTIKGRENHPVVHIAYADVEAYARWIGKEIPTEAEWEFAAQGGLENAEFAWGDELHPHSKMMANTWQGEFPWQNLKTDGYEGTSPVGVFPPTAMASTTSSATPGSGQSIGTRSTARLNRIRAVGNGSTRAEAALKLATTPRPPRSKFPAG